MGGGGGGVEVLEWEALEFAAKVVIKESPRYGGICTDSEALRNVLLASNLHVFCCSIAGGRYLKSFIKLMSSPCNWVMSAVAPVFCTES